MACARHLLKAGRQPECTENQHSSLSTPVNPSCSHLQHHLRRGAALAALLIPHLHHQGLPQAPRDCHVDGQLPGSCLGDGFIGGPQAALEGVVFGAPDEVTGLGGDGEEAGERVQAGVRGQVGGGEVMRALLLAMMCVEGFGPIKSWAEAGQELR